MGEGQLVNMALTRSCIQIQILEQDGCCRYYIQSLGHIRRTKGGLNSRLHAIVDEHGRPLMMCLTAEQISDHIGARIVYPILPEAALILIGDRILIGDKGYDSDDYRKALSAKGITSCIPPRKGRKSPASYCKTV